MLLFWGLALAPIFGGHSLALNSDFLFDSVDLYLGNGGLRHEMHSATGDIGAAH